MKNIKNLKTIVKTYTEKESDNLFYQIILQIFKKFFKIYEKDLQKSLYFDNKFYSKIENDLYLNKNYIHLFIYNLKNNTRLDQKYVNHILQIIYEKSGIRLETPLHIKSTLNNYEILYKLAKPFGILLEYFPLIYIEY